MESKIKRVSIKISGVNLSRIYKECEKQKISLYDIDRTDYKNIEFKVDLSQRDKIKQIAQNQNYHYKELNTFGINKYLQFFKEHIGLFVGAFFFAIIIAFSSQFVWNIKVYGNQLVSENQIIKVLKQNNVKIGAFSKNVDVEKLEKELTNSIDDISLCSVMKRGTTIIVNIKEKLHSAEYENFQSEQDIVAKCNMQITDLVVIQGTALKKVGDSVKAGDVIVAGYFFDINGKKVFCKANASIKATTWLTETAIYEKEKQVSVRTGKKVSDCYMILFGKKFQTKVAKNKFENYETQQNKHFMFENNFLPVQFISIDYYEVHFETLVQDFEKDREKVVSECEQSAIKKLRDGQIAKKVFSVVDEQEKQFLITSYVEVDIEF